MAYYTDNIAIAAALKMNSFKIIEIQVVGKKATFSFTDEAKLIANSIQLGHILVDAIQFHQEIRRLSALAKSMSNLKGN